MSHGITRRRRASSFMAGVLIGLAIVTPVFAAAGDPDNQWRTLLILGSLVLLFFGLLLEAITNAEPSRKLGPQVLRADIAQRAPQRRSSYGEVELKRILSVPYHD